jgi:hypothetical protein
MGPREADTLSPLRIGILNPPISSMLTPTGPARPHSVDCPDQSPISEEFRTLSARFRTQVDKKHSLATSSVT